MNFSIVGAGYDIPLIKLITDFILFLAVIIIVVRLKTIVKTKITITIIQIYFITYSGVNAFVIVDDYILFIKKNLL